MIDLTLRPLAEVVEDSVVALLDDLRGWSFQRAIFEVDARTAQYL